jgi:hypothetical protein
MRACLHASLVLSAFLLNAPLHAQAEKVEGKPKATVTTRTIVADLQTEANTRNMGNPMKFSDFLEVLATELTRNGRTVAIVVDQEVFTEENRDLPPVMDQEIHLKHLPATTTVHHLLRQAVKQLPMKAAYVIRAGKVEIVPAVRTSKEFMLNQTFHVDFKERRLDQALEELSELTGVSIVLDARARQKAQTAITARFHDDVALQDAVRMLADMAELKIVYLVTGLYVTTPEHAPVLQKELRRTYGLPEPGAAPAVLPMQGMPPEIDPLMPPLPPNPLRRPEAAGAA